MSYSESESDSTSDSESNSESEFDFSSVFMNLDIFSPYIYTLLNKPVDDSFYPFS